MSTLLKQWVTGIASSGIVSLSAATIERIALFYGDVANISAGRLNNEVPGASDYLTVTGIAGSYVFQCPNTADYINADTDFIWFKTNADQRSTTEAELVGYDLQRTPIMYDNESPFAIRKIMILKAGIVLSLSERNALFATFDLSVLWDNSFNGYGVVKENRFAQQLWTPESIYEPEIETFLAGITGELSPAQIGKLNTLVSTLKSGLVVSSMSDYFDAFVITGGEAIEDSLRNLVKNAHHGVRGGSTLPAFVQYEGFANAALLGYIDSNFNPTTAQVFTQTNNGMGFYTRNDVGAANTNSVLGNGIYSRWMLRYTGDIVRGNNNGLAVVNVLTANAETKGNYIFRRIDNVVGVSKNGAAFVTAAANAAALNNYNYYILGSNNEGTFAYGSLNQVSCYWFGKAPTDAEAIVINNAIEAYMDSNGKGIQS